LFNWFVSLEYACCNIANSASNAASWSDNPNPGRSSFELAGDFARSKGSGELESVRDDDLVGEELPVDPLHEDKASWCCWTTGQLTPVIRFSVDCITDGFIVDSISTSPSRTKLPPIILYSSTNLFKALQYISYICLFFCWCFSKKNQNIFGFLKKIM